MSDDDICDAIIASWVKEMRLALNAGAHVAAAIMVFVIIDSMAHIARPTNSDKAVRSDFKAWVDKYMHSQKPAEYIYTGDDLYDARCDMLHTFTNQFRPNKKNFTYHDGSHHRYRPDLHPDFVGLSVEALVDDLWLGIAEFVAEKRQGKDFALVEQRFRDVFRSVPFKH